MTAINSVRPQLATTNLSQSNPSSSRQELAARAPTDAFAAAPADKFQKPSYAGVTAGPDQWNNTELLYTVAQGDTWESVAKRLGTDAETLTNLNYRDDQTLKAGDKLTTPTTFHIVKRGDTYWDLAQKTGLDARQLMKLNGTTNELIRPGQELRVPAAVLSPEQQRLRTKLSALMDNAATAYGQTMFGEGSAHSYTRGNSLGWWGPVETSYDLQYSDDYSTVKVSHGEGESSDEELKGFPLPDTLNGTKELLMNDTISTVTWALWSTLQEKNPDVELKYPEKPTTLPNGSLRYEVAGPYDTVTTVTYDPKAGSLTTVDNSGSTTAHVELPTDIVATLKERLNLSLPRDPLGGGEF